ncbi:Glycosyl transferases group 1 [compost metagenome]
MFPRIRARIPHCKLYLVGAEPPKEVRALADIPGVEVTGFVEDPCRYLERAKVVVAPIRFGAGLKNKVLEGMALRKAVVTSTVGQEGIGGEDGREYLIADTADALTESVLRCFEDAALRDQLGTNARRWIERHFDARSIGEQTLRTLATLHPTPKFANA